MYQNGFPYGSYTNYYYPNMGAYQMPNEMMRTGGLRNLFAGTHKFNFSSFLGNAQKTLGIINQAIPIVYQVKPIWNNAKTMFRIAGALKEDQQEPSTRAATADIFNKREESPSYEVPKYSYEEGKHQSQGSNPQFFI